MEHSELATRFNEVGQTLNENGHLALIRKTRELIEGGNGSGAADFLEGAASKTNHDALSALAGELRAWATAGGAATELTSQGAWSTGKSFESRAANLIAAATTGGTDALVGSLAAQTTAHGAGEAITDIEAPADTTEETMQVSEDIPADAPPIADEPPTPLVPAAAPTGAIPPPAPYEGSNGYAAFAVGMAILIGGYVLFYSLLT